jgi:hypothetical protein
MPSERIEDRHILMHQTVSGEEQVSEVGGSPSATVGNLQAAAEVNSDTLTVSAHAQVRPWRQRLVLGQDSRR